jgi:ketosteroid isomerase-like protein
MSTETALVDETAERLFGAIERGDIAAVRDLWSEEVVVWKVADRDRRKDQAVRVIEWFVGATSRRRYEILERQTFDGGFVQQHILHADGHNGASIALRVCIVIKVGDDGLIGRIDEYFDPAEIAPLLPGV